MGLLQVLAAMPVLAIQTTIGGRQVDLDATFSVREVIEADRASTHERTLELLRLRAAVSLASWLRFDSTTVGTNGGPTIFSNRSGVYTFDNAFQDVSPAVDFQEAYFDVLLQAVDLRIGLQKFAWGKLDRTQPNDLINTLSYIDPFLEDEAERKLGIPAVQASYYFPSTWGAPEESRFTAVWVPLYVPFRFSRARCEVMNDVSQCNIERWFPPAGVPPTTFTIPLPPGSPLPSVTVPVAYQVRNVAPDFRLENNEIALRYSALIRAVDTAFYYYHGFDSQPAFVLSAAALGTPDPMSPLGLKDLSASTTLTPAYKHIDSLGADMAYGIDRFTVRGEGAFIFGRPFSRDLRFLVTDPSSLLPQIPGILAGLARGEGSVPVELPPSFVTRDTLEWGIGGDYTYAGYFLLLQVNQTDIFNNDVTLLYKNIDTRLLANLRKSFFGDRLQTQFVALQAFESAYTMLRPRLQYRLTDSLLAEAGYLFISGRQQSVIGQYKHNDEGWVRMEYRL